MKRLGFLVIALALGACAKGPGQASVSGGECKFLERPSYAVKGARQYDQDWIDSTVEGGVGACGWDRPAPRPAAMDAAPVPVKAKPRPAPVKKPKAWLRFLHALHKPAPAPEAVPVTPIADPPPESPAPAPAPRRPIDELLGVK